MSQNDTLSENVDELTPIQKFYQHKSIFITGGTGFLGKVLIDKLLRTCDPDIIFILIRPKKGKDIQTRVEDLFNDAVFDRLKREQPKFRHKIFPISGDCGLPDLGLNQEERTKIQRTVHVVFHVAATTRFNEKLKLAMEVNVNSTKEMLALCHQMDHLKAVVHVSTAYANCNRDVIEEKFYPPKLSGANALHLLGCMDEKMLDEITPILIKGWPNTYTFTKCLAEDLVRSSSKDIPICVFRPAIVIPTSKEPVSGWTDNMFGPNGIIVGFWTGLLSVMHIQQENYAEIVPVDMCVNGVITSAWEVASTKHCQPPIYNFVTSDSKRIKWREFEQLAARNCIKMPLLQSIWYYRFKMTSNKLLADTMQFFYHILPALVMDCGLLCAGKKPKMLRTFSRMHQFSALLRYFTEHHLQFHSRNTRNLSAKLEQRDKDLFYFDMSTINWDEFIASMIVGLRKYLLKEDPTNMAEAIKRYQRLKYLHYLTVCAFYLVGLSVLYKLWPGYLSLFKPFM